MSSASRMRESCICSCTHTQEARGRRCRHCGWPAAKGGPADPPRSHHMPEKVPAPCQGRVDYSEPEHHKYRILIERMLTSIASTPPCLTILYWAMTSISNVSSRSSAIRSVVEMTLARYFVWFLPVQASTGKTSFEPSVKAALISSFSLSNEAAVIFFNNERDFLCFN